ncbi:hypothetical protein UPYG_G00049950 [Umbra pygmaea]|uniref:Uncharacterized protein n=1 Tax=Umbra pygmaea TaxID=75934 RepID=A0ABD0XRM4_UMBPY
MFLLTSKLLSLPTGGAKAPASSSIRRISILASLSACACTSILRISNSCLLLSALSCRSASRLATRCLSRSVSLPVLRRSGEKGSYLGRVRRAGATLSPTPSNNRVGEGVLNPLRSSPNTSSSPALSTPAANGADKCP